MAREAQGLNPPRRDKLYVRNLKLPLSVLGKKRTTPYVTGNTRNRVITMLPMFQEHTRKDGTNPAADPRLPKMSLSAVKITNAHPHCDQGVPGCFASETIFSFVAIHGFGLSDFQMWILPIKKRRDYGFLYQFPKTAILFLRGDCPHAGACLQETAWQHSLLSPRRSRLGRRQPILGSEQN